MIIPKEGKAFLKLISFAEGTLKTNDPYRTVFGYGHTIKDLSDHPAITGEWIGKRLPDRYCRKAGLRSGCKSTAAGAYQITKITWLDKGLRRLYKPNGFFPEEQDNFTWFAICKTLKIDQALTEDSLIVAMTRAGRRWASFPSSSVGQPKQKISTLKNFYDLELERITTS